ncbi:Hypothetical protein F387_00484 [Wohlfahrtiimonas chitiniclastica SH04]|uniref:Uncharacterized protein n=1 Tax=Wohlfahrtiimonas chitiniclastica SH04 TaxID=1261130 RepID=L8Y164_9GAMM|nr:Hypothetical protein F387_00484 [Wohlfahrtiimonas chitiniclastica SH04]
MEKFTVPDKKAQKTKYSQASLEFCKNL